MSAPPRFCAMERGGCSGASGCSEGDVESARWDFAGFRSARRGGKEGIAPREYPGSADVLVFGSVRRHGTGPSALSESGRGGVHRIFWSARAETRHQSPRPLHHDVRGALRRTLRHGGDRAPGGARPLRAGAAGGARSLGGSLRPDRGRAGLGAADGRRRLPVVPGRPGAVLVVHLHLPGMDLLGARRRAVSRAVRRIPDWGLRHGGLFRRPQPLDARAHLPGRHLGLRLAQHPRREGGGHLLHDHDPDHPGAGHRDAAAGRAPDEPGAVQPAGSPGRVDLERAEVRTGLGDLELLGLRRARRRG